MERATAVGTRNAIRYVRRATELCEALSAPVPGLSQDCLEYVKAHPSNVYDMPALHLFARGLLQAGQRDKAAAVYFTLLQASSLFQQHKALPVSRRSPSRRRQDDSKQPRACKRLPVTTKTADNDQQTAFTQEGDDKAQQASLLRQCLACWNTAATVGGAEAEPGMQDSVEMLVSFVEQSDGPTAAQLVDIAQAILPKEMLRLHCLE